MSQMEKSEPAPDAVCDPELSALIERLLRGLSAYRNEVQLYPEDHPRLEERRANLHEELAEYLIRCAHPLSLQVHAGTLYSDNLPVDADEEQLHRMAGLLKERMVQLVMFEPGITIDQLEKFIQLLLRDPEDMVDTDERSLELGRALKIYFFPPTFSEDELLTQEDIVAGNYGADDEHENDDSVEIMLEGVHMKEWGIFDDRQLKNISRVLSDQELQAQIDEVRESVAVDSGGRDFLRAFFETMRKDPRTDWTNVADLRKRITAGLDLLRDAQRADGMSKAIPVHLLAPEDGKSDQVTTHLRWLLIRNFFPGQRPEVSPRQAEDLSFGKGAPAPDTPPDADEDEWQLSGGGWCLTEVPNQDWGKTEPEDLAGGIHGQFEPHELLGEFTDVVLGLQHLNPDDDALLSDYMQMVEHRLANGHLDRSDLDSVRSLFDELPVERRWRWKEQLLGKVVEADRLVTELAGGDTSLLEKIVAIPLPLDEPTVPTPGDTAAEVRETLRAYLARRDRFALDVLLSLIDHGVDLGGNVWRDTTQALVSDSDDLEEWFDARCEQLLAGPAMTLFLLLPLNRVQARLQSQLLDMPPHHLHRYLEQLTQRQDPAVLQYVVMGLDLDSAVTRRSSIVALGSAATTRALQVLMDLLRDNNDLSYDAEEVDLLLRTLVRMGTPEAHLFLEQVASGGGTQGRWKRAIRKLAKRAAASGGRR